MQRLLEDLVDEILGIVRREPVHVYWHGLEQCRHLHAHPDKAIDLLTPALKEPQPEVRRYVARLIRELDRERAARILSTMLFDPDEDVRLEASGAVLDQPAMYGRDPPRERPKLDASTQQALVTALLPLIASRKLYVFERAVQLLEICESTAHVPALLARLPEPDWNFRVRILGALGRVHGAVGLLRPLIDHADAETRASALLTLSNSVHGAEMTAELASAIIARLDDSHEDVRTSAALCIGRLEIRGAEAKLLELVAAASKDQPQYGLFTALGLLRADCFVPVLVAHLKPECAAQSAAISALARFPPRPEIEAALLDVLERSPDLDARADAAKALAEVGTAKSIPALEHFLAKDARRLTKRLRKEALRTLPDAINRLRKRSG